MYVRIPVGILYLPLCIPEHVHMYTCAPLGLCTQHIRQGVHLHVYKRVHTYIHLYIAVYVHEFLYKLTYIYTVFLYMYLFIQSISEVCNKGEGL